ncbi:exodeoxyribonuclease III [Thiohalorhabdus denitrificans]|uniref:Exodeoxyribonuclease III n=1 Tax=Thiohalorhabdus denitrificans TaxID=381306 RepID=A0A0P9EF91_9GAMM|nr:exodeoxyribonuclease III [Thiohalorhabdus denitrificans]KPV41001.1 exodeoxyribonuclease III [Thiohalorhabdus denitrificans]SCY42141.1 Exodeoxyribonuclease III [Thiohalorhabdus denitrificans]
MKIATWNVNSIRTRKEHVRAFLEEHRPDVLGLQEIKVTDDQFPAAFFAEAGYRSTVYGQKTYNGVAFLAREGFHEAADVARGFPDEGEDAHSRLIAARFGPVVVVNIYLPNGSEVGSEKYAYKLDWMQRLREWLDATYGAEEPVVLVGDFNVAPEDRDVHDPEAWRGRVLFSEPEKEALEAIRAWGFTDCFRLHHEDAGRFSWWDYRMNQFRRDMGLRIDHVWASRPAAEACSVCDIIVEPRRWERPSDHAPVVAEIDL